MMRSPPINTATTLVIPAGAPPAAPTFAYPSLDLHPATPPIVSHDLQQARSPRPAHPCYTANRAQPPPPPNLAKPYPVAQSP